MHVEKSDERDSQWERHRSTFRVYFFEGPARPYSVRTYDVADATFTDAKTWRTGKQATAGIQLHSYLLTNVENAG
jgi:hypothetical protein